MGGVMDRREIGVVKQRDAVRVSGRMCPALTSAACRVIT